VITRPPTQADDLLPPSIGRVVVVLVNAVHQQITVDMYSAGGIEPVNGSTALTPRTLSFVDGINRHRLGQPDPRMTCSIRSGQRAVLVAEMTIAALELGQPLASELLQKLGQQGPVATLPKRVLVVP
jgi:hypothetical protein